MAAVAVTLAGFLAVAIGQSWVFFAGIAATVLYYFLRQHRIPLEVVTPQQAKTSNRSAWIMLLATIFPALFS